LNCGATSQQSQEPGSRSSSTPLLVYLAPYRARTSIFPTLHLHSHTHLMANTAKKTVLVIGGGAVGAVAALNLDVGGLAEVTIVLRSNYEAVQESGYDFESIDHGAVNSWKPSVGRCQLSSSTRRPSKLAPHVINTSSKSATPSPTSSKKTLHHTTTFSSPPKTSQTFHPQPWIWCYPHYPKEMRTRLSSSCKTASTSRSPS
jgi:hypothetical protein